MAFIGDHAGDVMTTGTDNVAIGDHAGDMMMAGTDSVAIGRPIPHNAHDFAVGYPDNEPIVMGHFDRPSYENTVIIGYGMEATQDGHMIIGSENSTAVCLMGTEVEKNDKNVLWMMMKKILAMEKIIISQGLNDIIGGTKTRILKYL